MGTFSVLIKKDGKTSILYAAMSVNCNNGAVPTLITTEAIQPGLTLNG